MRNCKRYLLDIPWQNKTGRTSFKGIADMLKCEVISVKLMSQVIEKTNKS